MAVELVSTQAAAVHNCADTGGVGHQFHWDAETYLESMRAEVPDYDRLQEETAEATRPVEARAILELGTGTGETARRLLGCTHVLSSSESTRGSRCLRRPVDCSI